MKVFKLAKRDLQLGMWKKARYIVFLIVCVVGCMNFATLITEGTELFGNSAPSMADCLAYIFQGIEPMVRKEAMSEFHIPPIWLMLMLLYLLMPLDYPVKSMEVWGSQYLIRVNRRSWWSAKCIYTIGVNVFTFTLHIFIVFLFCVVKRIPISMHNSKAFYEALYGGVTVRFQSSLSAQENIILLIVLPLLGIISMSMLQLFMAIWINPYVAYLISIVLLVYSVYLNHPALLANQTMTIRSLLVDEKGIAPLEGIQWCVGICIFVSVLGMFLVKGKDMLVLKKEDV